ncbi:hypothetical protein J5N97_022730 [Dioscorea zingiberensis]|uniref:Thioredoxin-like fold domain-containing protein n=1 Tax=Dioscorea zingiberensis TaxID=325984 RepID=A0A9D5CAY2_9LILI|nr:hypothetical protein J5N97_022730 [Dioscorea zingiberensis]
MSEASIISHMAKLTARTIGEDSLPSFLSAFKDHDQMNYAARISFKYGCLRGVTGTPFFFVNGFPLPEWGTPLNYTKWASIFDSLVEKK